MFLDSTDDWKMKANLYWAQFVYGLLSFPFLIFAVPLCPAILTKARPTAYDRDGRCVPTYVATEAYVKAYGQKINASVVVGDAEEDKPIIEVDDLDYALA